MRRCFIYVVIGVLCIATQASYALRPLSSGISSVAYEFNSDASAPKTAPTGQPARAPDAPPSYFVPDISIQDWRGALAELGGPIIDVSEEALIPELGWDALQGSKGGLGILEGDSGEGYSQSVTRFQVPGVKAFITMPMYEYRLVAGSDTTAGEQRLRRVDIGYENLIDSENPVDYRIFADEARFVYPELRRNKAKPIKPLSDEKGEHIKFQVRLFNSEMQQFRDVDVAIYVINRGGTPVFLVACKEVHDILYTDNEARRLEQQVLIGKAVPMLYKRMGIRPSILRLNEAHTVITMAEMIQDPYFNDTAYVFTNHTPIPAGLQKYYGKAHWFSRLDIPERYRDEARGIDINFREIFVDEEGNLNFSHAAMALAHIVNGVSARHAEVLKGMFPQFADKITGIMNGTGQIWKSYELRAAESRVEEMTPEVLWGVHQRDKEAMARLIEKVTNGTGSIDLNMPTAIAVRRIDYYKQQYPMLKDIIRALCEDKGVRTRLNVDGVDMELEGLGMQVVIGGIIVDEHNQDLQGWIREFMSWMEDPAFKGRFIFVSGNDIELMRQVAAGCDCWIEMPEPPKEACGTSGMRAAENGNIPVASKDGWALEFIRQFNPATGEGNGFLIQENNQISLYNELKVISELYYAWTQKQDRRWIELRKKIYEESKALYIKNMIKRYILEAFLPAVRIKRALSSIRQISNLNPGVNGVREHSQGDSMAVSCDITLTDPSVIGGISAQIWTNASGSWEALEMGVPEAVDADTFRFRGKVYLPQPGHYRYKVRFDIGKGHYLYFPKGLGNDGNIFVKEVPAQDAPSGALGRKNSAISAINSSA